MHFKVWDNLVNPSHKMPVMISDIIATGKTARRFLDAVYLYQFKMTFSMNSAATFIGMLFSSVKGFRTFHD